MLDMSGFVTGNINSFFMLFTTMERNRVLSQENLVLNFENNQIKEILEENQRLRDLLQLREQSPFKFEAAEIITWNPTPAVSSVTINKGENDGLSKDMPVISMNGLVGKIVETGKYTSVCQLLTDRNFRVTSKIGNSQTEGILAYQMDNFAVVDIPKSAAAAIGDTVNTSFRGNIYPEGIRIGKVVAIEEQPGLYKSLKVILFVKYSRLKQVLVIIDEKAQSSIERN